MSWLFFVYLFIYLLTFFFILEEQSNKIQDLKKTLQDNNVQSLPQKSTEITAPGKKGKVGAVYKRVNL